MRNDLQKNQFQNCHFMKNFTLESLFKISGIGSASGLVYKNDSLFLISDNSNALYEYFITERKLHKINLTEYNLENIPKIIKPDFESITQIGNKLYLFGSGSTVNRNKRITYNLSHKKSTEKNLGHLFEKMRQKADIPADDLNIEGALYHDKKWLFFQRGNGSQSKNGIFIWNKEKKDLHFFPIVLPKTQHIETTFTDAILVDDKIYFLAAVENTISTYDDGEILGCCIGCMSLETFEIIYMHEISNANKFEGLTLFKNSDTDIEFLLCEDNDSDVLETMIYKLTLPKQNFL